MQMGLSGIQEDRSPSPKSQTAEKMEVWEYADDGVSAETGHLFFPRRLGGTHCLELLHLKLAGRS